MSHDHRELRANEGFMTREEWDAKVRALQDDPNFSSKPQRFFNEKTKQMEEKCESCGATKVGPW